MYSLSPLLEEDDRIPLSHDASGIPQAEIMTMQQAEAEGLELIDYTSGGKYDRQAALNLIDIALPRIVKQARENDAPKHRVQNPESLDLMLSEVKQNFKASFQKVPELLAAINESDDYANDSDGEKVEDINEPTGLEDDDGQEWYNKPVVHSLFRHGMSQNQ